MPQEPRIPLSGEDRFIEKIKTILGEPSRPLPLWIGDDAAVLPAPKNAELVFTTDLLVEGVHFRLEWASPWQIGWKAMAASVSDVYAMGGRPVWATVSAGMPSRMLKSVAPGVLEGIAAAARKYNVTVAGGDTVRADRLIVNVAMLGEVPKGRAITRKGAKPGDMLFVTGECGDSAAGLEILSAKGRKVLPRAEKALTNERISAKDNKTFTRAEKALTTKHLAPEPSAEAAYAIAASGAATAMMDLSDGIATDLPRLARASSAGATIRIDKLPVSPELAVYSSSAALDPADFALSGGEDFNLLIAANPEKSESMIQLAAASGFRLTHIGEITKKSEGLKIIGRDGKTRDWPDSGFRHF